MGYQIKCLAYTDPGMRGDMRRMLRGTPWRRPWLELAVYFARVLAFGLCAAFGLMAAIVTAGCLMDSGMVEGREWVPPLLWGCFAVFLVLGLMIRPMPDPIRDRLWPPETRALIVTCDEAAIQIEDGRMTIRMSYRDLQAVRETRLSFYLFPMEGRFLMLRRRDFVRGDPDTFAAFLMEKMMGRSG